MQVAAQVRKIVGRRSLWSSVDARPAGVRSWKSRHEVNLNGIVSGRPCRHCGRKQPFRKQTAIVGPTLAQDAIQQPRPRLSRRR